jgi:flagellar hook-associated protein 3 FlgL
VSTRVTTGMVQRNVLADLNAVSARVTKAQMRAASGKQLTRPSDDPFNTSRALALRQDLEATRQYQRNVDDGDGWLKATDAALTQINDAVQLARDLVLQGASDSSDPAAREAIAAQVEQLVKSVKESANANYRGSYLFSGTRTDTPPYDVDGADTYAGDGGTIARQIGPGTSIEVNVRADDALGGATGVLSTLRGIVTHLRAGDGEALRTGDLQALDDGIDKLLGIQAAGGARSNRLEAATGRLAELEEQTISQLSVTEDADIAKTLIDLNSQTAAYQAALRAGASLLQVSLMDFLR